MIFLGTFSHRDEENSGDRIREKKDPAAQISKSAENPFCQEPAELIRWESSATRQEDTHQRQGNKILSHLHLCCIESGSDFDLHPQPQNSLVRISVCNRCLESKFLLR